MSEFILLFRRDNKDDTISPEQMQELGKKWWTWRNELEAKNKIAAVGNRLSKAGRVVNAKNVVTDGPYAEIKEVLNGYMVVNAGDFDEAVVVAKGCPILQMGGNVEVRKFIAPDDNES
jgi:hypothetical protein